MRRVRIVPAVALLLVCLFHNTTYGGTWHCRCCDSTFYDGESRVSSNQRYREWFYSVWVPNHQLVCCQRHGNSQEGVSNQGASDVELLLKGYLSPKEYFKYELMKTASNAMVDLINQSIHGNPGEEAQKAADRREKLARIFAEQQLRQAEHDRAEQEQLDLLNRLLKPLPGSGKLTMKSLHGDRLKFKVGDDLFGEKASEVQLNKSAGEFGTPSESAILQLKRAAYLSQLAAGANGIEEKKALSEEAFRAATGGDITGIDASDVKGIPITNEEVVSLERIRTEYSDAITKNRKADADLAQAALKKGFLDEAKKEAARRVEEQKQKVDLIPADQPERKKEEESKEAEARRLLDEATQDDDRAQANLDKAKNDAEVTQKQLTESGNKAREFVKGLGTRITPTEAHQ